jgi:thiol-disulfide isomerase/thioredoxin
MPSKIEKKVDTKLLVSAIIISAIIFISGVAIGYGINREKLTTIEQDMNSIIKDVQDFQLQLLFLDVLGENATCPLLSSTLSNINEKSYRIGTRLESYSSESEIQDVNEYNNLKNEYSRLLIGYWLLAGKLRRNCELSANTVIYFYDSGCENCEDQAFVLTYLKNKLEENFLVFALDADSEEPSIIAVKEFYDINKYPSLVVDEELYEGFHSTETLEKILNL